MKHMKPHEVLRCEPYEIYIDNLMSIGCEVVDSIKLERLLYRRGQFPEEYFLDDESSPSITDIIKKHYGSEAIESIKFNLAEVDSPKIK